MEKMLAAAAIALALTGCAHTKTGNGPSRPALETGRHEQPFLPAYLDMLRGQKPLPTDGACHPSDLHELLLPCDRS